MNGTLPRFSAIFTWGRVNICDFLFPFLNENFFQNEVYLFLKERIYSHRSRWRSRSAKVLGKLSVPGHPTNLDNSRVRAYCACSRCGWGLFGHFFSHLSFSLFFLPLWKTARYRLNLLSQRAVKPKTTNQLVGANSVLQKLISLTNSAEPDKTAPWNSPF